MNADGTVFPDRWRGFTVVAAGVLLSFRFGFNFGIGNHNTYLLHALRRVHPELLTADWLATSTQDYHPVFTHMAALLLRLNESGWLFALMNVLCVTFCAVIVYLISRQLLSERLALPAFLLTAAFMGVGGTYSAGGSYLFSATFQPSTVAVMGCLLAALWFLRAKYLASGICLALAGLFHANFAVLVVPWFGLAHLLLGWRGSLRRLVVQLAPVCATLALLSPLLLSQAGSPHAEEARFIFQHVLSPQHYVPSAFWTELVVFYAWCALGWLVGRTVLFGGENRRLGVLWLASLVLVSLATLLTTVVFIPTVSQLYFWRLAPFTVLFSQWAAAAGFLALLESRPDSFTIPRRVLAVALAAVPIWLLFRYHYGEYRFLQYGLLIALAALFLLKPALVKFTSPRVGMAALAVWSVWLVVSQVHVSSLSARSSLLAGLPKDEVELYVWAATTPTQSVFLVPPQLENFRLNARRAVVADMKSTPVEPEQLLEWYRRMGIVCGLDSVQGAQAASAAYSSLDSARLASIEQSFAIDYVVVAEGQDFAGTRQWQPAFSSHGFRVYSRLPDPHS